MKREVGLIGRGFVGKSVYKWFGKIPFYTKDNGDFKTVDKMKYIFLCLPTPYSAKEGFDISALEENIKKLTPQKNIIIKSTVLPGTTKELQRKYRHHNFFVNPEFLRAATPLKDFMRPDRQIVGYAKKNHKRLASKILDMLPKSDNNCICSSDEAEMIKIVGNCFLATKVIFANRIYDYCQKKKINYDNIIKMVKADPRIGDSHWNIHFNDYRGYAGYCFPKDMCAIIWDSKDELLSLVDKINRKLLPDKIRKEFYYK